MYQLQNLHHIINTDLKFSREDERKREAEKSNLRLVQHDSRPRDSRLRHDSSRDRHLGIRDHRDSRDRHRDRSRDRLDMRRNHDRRDRSRSGGRRSRSRGRFVRLNFL